MGQDTPVSPEAASRYPNTTAASTPAAGAGRAVGSYATWTTRRTQLLLPAPAALRLLPPPPPGTALVRIRAASIEWVPQPTWIALRAPARWAPFARGAHRQRRGARGVRVANVRRVRAQPRRSVLVFLAAVLAALTLLAGSDMRDGYDGGGWSVSWDWERAERARLAEEER